MVLFGNCGYGRLTGGQGWLAPRSILIKRPPHRHTGCCCIRVCTAIATCGEDQIHLARARGPAGSVLELEAQAKMKAKPQSSAGSTNQNGAHRTQILAHRHTELRITPQAPSVSAAGTWLLLDVCGAIVRANNYIILMHQFAPQKGQKGKPSCGAWVRAGPGPGEG